MNQAPYRDIYHLLNRALSGVTLERYIKSGWQLSYTAKAADTRRLDNFNDGLNNLERNAQDALSVHLIQKGLEGQAMREAILWLRHNQDPALLNYLVSMVSSLMDNNHKISKIVLKEFSGFGQSLPPFSDFLKHAGEHIPSAHRKRLALRHKLASNYDAAVQQLEPWLQSHGLLHQW